MGAAVLPVLAWMVFCTSDCPVSALAGAALLNATIRAVTATIVISGTLLCRMRNPCGGGHQCAPQKSSHLTRSGQRRITLKTQLDRIAQIIEFMHYEIDRGCTK